MGKGYFFSILLLFLGACTSTTHRGHEFSSHSYSALKNFNQRTPNKPKYFQFQELNFLNEEVEINPRTIASEIVLQTSEKQLESWEQQVLQKRQDEEKKNLESFRIKRAWWVLGQKINSFIELEDELPNYQALSEIVYGNKIHAEHLEIWNASKNLKKGAIIYYASELEPHRDEMRSIVAEYRLEKLKVVVHKGDTLSILAKKYLGRTEGWRKIHQENYWIFNPDQIEVGDEIVIPRYNIAQQLAVIHREIRDDKEIALMDKASSSFQLLQKRIKQESSAPVKYAPLKKDRVKVFNENPLYRWWKEQGIQASFQRKVESTHNQRMVLIQRIKNYNSELFYQKENL